MLGSSWVLAQQPSTPTPPPSTTPPAATEPAKPADVAAPAATPSATPAGQVTDTAKPATPPAPTGQADFMAKRKAFRQQMREHMQKIQEAKDPQERQHLMQEYDQAMQKHRQEMWGMGSGEYAGGGREGTEEEASPPARPYYGPSYGYGPPPGCYGGGCGRPFGRGGMPGPGGFMGPQQAHQAAVERHLEKIEKLLETIVDSLPDDDSEEGEGK